MTWATQDLFIEEEKLTIRTLRREDCRAAAEALIDPEGWFARNWGCDSPQKIEDMLAARLLEHGNNLCHPLIYTVGLEVAGITRFLNIDAASRVLEIGGSWVSPKWRRTFVNTSVKRLVLEYVFERLGGGRVEFRVDEKNFISQMAVLGIGARFEGTLSSRQFYVDGRRTNAFLYAVTRDEWPALRARLLAKRDRVASEAPFLPLQLKTERLDLRVLNLDNAAELLELARENRDDCLDSFRQLSKVETLNDARAYVADKAHLAASGQGFFYGAFVRETGELVGQLHIKSLDWAVRSAELGYIVSRSFRRQGLAGEMVNAAVNETIHNRNFARVYARVLCDNPASAALLAKLGFESEGVERNAFLTGCNMVASLEKFVKYGPSSQRSLSIK